MIPDVSVHTPTAATASQQPPAAAAIVDVNHLVKRYGRFTAVNDVSFAIRRGEIFGLLGPNGAGKTTTLEIIEGLRRGDGGQVTVDGLDVRRDRRAVQQRIGVQLQATTLFDGLPSARRFSCSAHSMRRRGRRTICCARWRSKRRRAPCPAISRVASGNDSRSPWRWSTIPRCCCWMSQRPASIPRAAANCGIPFFGWRARQDDGADDALHGPGADSLRPHRDSRRWALIAQDTPAGLIGLLEASATIESR